MNSAKMKNKEYRHGLVNAQIEVDLPLQIRALRQQRGLTQPELAGLAGMKQPRISAMEKPGGSRFNLETLRRLAEAFDIALIVRFAPFSELLAWSKRFSPDDFRVPQYDEDSDVKASAERTASAGAAVPTLGSRSGSQAPVNVTQESARVYLAEAWFASQRYQASDGLVAAIARASQKLNTAATTKLGRGLAVVPPVSTRGQFSCKLGPQIRQRRRGAPRRQPRAA